MENSKNKGSSILSYQNTLTVLAVLVAVSIGRGLVGPGPLRVYTHDSWFLIDGAWRILHGQVPHVDFYSPLGFMCYLPTVLGFTFSHGAEAVNWGQCFCGVLVAAISVPVVFARMRPPFSALYCTALTLLALAPFSPGEFFTMATQSVFYNRLGYALLGILFVECVKPVLSGGNRLTEFLGGAVAGFAIGFLFFLKFTYAAYGVVLIVAMIPLRPQTRTRWIGIVAAGVLTGMAGLAFLRFNIGALIHDVRMLAAARPVGVLYFLGKPMQNLPRLVSICAFASVVSLVFRDAGSKRRGWQWGWIFLVTLGIDILALGTNTFRQPSDFPFSALAILAMVDDVQMAASRPLLVWGLSIALINPLLDAAGLLSDTLGRFRSARFVSSRVIAPGDDFITTEFYDPRTGTNSLVDEIKDGLSLLDQKSQPTEKIFTFWVENPFAYWLQRTPMKGGSTCFDYGNTYTEKSAPTPSEAFGDADVVLVSRGAEEGSLPMKRIYGPYLEANFTRAAESRYWWLYRKK